ncbi:MAG: hypothetical protein ACI4PR_01935 [Acutalibacteraceae bacterium]
MKENMELMITNEGYSVNLNLGNDIQDELAGLDSGFDRIKIPAGGGTSFEVPNLENSDEPTFIKEFSAVILHHHPLFTYYENKYNGSSNPPDCCSFDGINGTGTPGGRCRFCKLNTFGSGENGAKACKNKHRLYLLRENEIFPDVLILPASSIQEFSKYIRRLLSIGRKSDSVVTKLTLKKAVNKTGITFSRVHFSVSRDLEMAEIERLKPFIEQIKNFAENSFDMFEEALGV